MNIWIVIELTKGNYLPQDNSKWPPGEIKEVYI